MYEELRSIDVNLLVVLDVLLKERNVSRAAERLACGQPAVSKKLATLRRIFDDQLLVRQGREMFHTPRAALLAQGLSDALQRLGNSIQPPEAFRPETARGLVRMGIRYTGVTILPHLLARLHALAPGLDIHTQNLHNEEPQLPLARGDVDLVLQPSMARVTSVSRGQIRTLAQSLYSQRLYSTEWVCVVRRKHPSITKALSLQQYTDTPHILISMRGDAYGFVDAALAQMGKERRIGLLVQNFTEAYLHATGTDYILTTHLDMAIAMRDLFPLQVLKVPLSLEPVTLNQVWHERTTHDPMQKWVRQTVFEIGKTLDVQYRAERKKMRL